MTEPRKRRPAAPPVGRQIKDLEDRLAHLEAMLADVRAEAGRSSGAARARLERVAEAVAERTAQARETLSVTLDRVSRALLVVAGADRARGRAPHARAARGRACRPRRLSGEAAEVEFAWPPLTRGTK